MGKHDVKPYGKIYHLRGSHLTEGDMLCTPWIEKLATKQLPDDRWLITITEKLDGRNVGVMREGEHLKGLDRAGTELTCNDALEDHRRFIGWLETEYDRFRFLGDGELLCGEWLGQAHGTRYDLKQDGPFFPFDLFIGDRRLTCRELETRIDKALPLPAVLHRDGPCSVPQALDRLRDVGRTFGDHQEGCVWRIEPPYDGPLLCKYVLHSHDKDRFLPHRTGQKPVWNWPVEKKAL